MKIAVLALVATTLACTLPTNTQCSDLAVAGLTVYVFDQAAGTALCDANVVATDGPYTETLQLQSPTSGCFYTGAYERAGTYDLVASAPNHQTITQSAIVVTQAGCHVSGRTITIEL